MAEQVLMPMVGKVISVDVTEGQKVAQDDVLGIFESMKMEMPLMAPVDGVVKDIKAKAGQVLEAEALFCTIE
jgi:biotin carboxyl carrier protein